MISIAFLAVLSATSADGGVTDAGSGDPPAIDFSQACNQYSFNPDCLKAAPIKVECPKTREEVTLGSLCGLEGTTTSTPRCTFG